MVVGESFHFAVSVLLWVIVLLSLGLVGYWLYLLVVVGRRTESRPIEHDPDAVQVRILTIDSESVVQETVNAIPDSVTDRHVIAEAPLSIDGATVHVVPDSFDCNAIRKGRALEWARRNVPCSREFVLYLDEDTDMSTFTGIPDADVIQFRERPWRTGSLLCYLAELYRMGAQLEQRAFPSLAVPLYAWGGGIAIRQSIEDQVTWDRPSIIEDTTFVWDAVGAIDDLEFAVAADQFRTQAPPTIRALIGQRRRWFAGSWQNASQLSTGYRAITTLRNLAWSVSAIVPLIMLLPTVAPDTVIFGTAFEELSVLIVGALMVWILLGVRYHDESLPIAVLSVVLLPLVSVLHSVGAFVGLLVPPRTFSVTEKVDPPTQQ